MRSIARVVLTCSVGALCAQHGRVDNAKSESTSMNKRSQHLLTALLLADFPRTIRVSGIVGRSTPLTKSNFIRSVMPIVAVDSNVVPNSNPGGMEPIAIEKTKPRFVEDRKNGNRYAAALCAQFVLIAALYRVFDLAPHVPTPLAYVFFLFLSLNSRVFSLVQCKFRYSSGVMLYAVLRATAALYPFQAFRGQFFSIPLLWLAFRLCVRDTFGAVAIVRNRLQACILGFLPLVTSSLLMKAFYDVKPFASYLIALASIEDLPRAVFYCRARLPLMRSMARSGNQLSIPVAFRPKAFWKELFGKSGNASSVLNVNGSIKDKLSLARSDGKKNTKHMNSYLQPGGRVEIGVGLNPVTKVSTEQGQMLLDLLQRGMEKEFVDAFMDNIVKIGLDIRTPIDESDIEARFAELHRFDQHRKVLLDMCAVGTESTFSPNELLKDIAALKSSTSNVVSIASVFGNDSKLASLVSQGVTGFLAEEDTARITRIEAAKLYMKTLQFGYFLSQVTRGKNHVGWQKPASNEELAENILRARSYTKTDLASLVAANRAAALFNVNETQNNVASDMVREFWERSAIGDTLDNISLHASEWEALLAEAAAFGWFLWGSEMAIIEHIRRWSDADRVEKLFPPPPLRRAES